MRQGARQCVCVSRFSGLKRLMGKLCVCLFIMRIYIYICVVFYILYVYVFMFIQDIHVFCALREGEKREFAPKYI